MARLIRVSLDEELTQPLPIDDEQLVPVPGLLPEPQFGWGFRGVRAVLDDDAPINATLTLDEEYFLSPVPEPDYTWWTLHGVRAIAVDDDFAPLPSSNPGAGESRARMDAVRVRYLYGTDDVVPQPGIADDDVGVTGAAIRIADPLVGRWPQPIVGLEDELPPLGAIAADEGEPPYYPPDQGYQVVPLPSTWDQDEWVPTQILNPEEEYASPVAQRWPDPAQLRALPFFGDDEDLPTASIVEDDAGVIPPILWIWTLGQTRPMLPSLWDQDEVPSSPTVAEDDAMPASAFRIAPLLTFAPAIIWDQADFLPIALDEDFSIPRVVDARYYDALRPLPITDDGSSQLILGTPTVMRAQLRVIPVFSGSLDVRAVMTAALTVNPQPTEP